MVNSVETHKVAVKLSHETQGKKKNTQNVTVVSACLIFTSMFLTSGLLTVGLHTPASVYVRLRRLAQTELNVSTGCGLLILICVMGQKGERRANQQIQPCRTNEAILLVFT